MAKGTKYGSISSPDLDTWASFTSVPNAVTNQSVVTAKLYIRASGSGDHSVPASGKFCGSSFSGTYNLPLNTAVVLKTVTWTVTHNADGTSGIYLSASFNATYLGTVYSGAVTSTYFALDTNDRTAPSVVTSLPSITTDAIIIVASASATCNAWYYKINGGSWVLFSQTSETTQSVEVTGLTPNTAYTIQTAANKAANGVMGYSAATSATTLGSTTLNSVQTVTADNATVQIIINRSVNVAAYTYDLAVKNGGTTILTLSGLTGSVGTADQTIALTAEQRTALLAAMANIKSFTGTFVLTTYDGGSQVGSTSSKTATVQTTTVNSAPIFTTFSYEDSNAVTSALTGNDQNIIAGYSNLLFTISAANKAVAKNGASMVRYLLTCGTKQLQVNYSTSDVTGTLSAVDAAAVMVTAIDSRGYQTTAQLTATLITHTGIKLKTVVPERDNNFDAATKLTLTGEIVLTDFGAVTNSIKSCAYQYREKGTETWTNGATTLSPSVDGSGNISISAEAIAGDLGASGFTIEKAFDFQVTIADELSSKTLGADINVGLVGMALKKFAEGYGLSVGEVPAGEGIYSSDLDTTAKDVVGAINEILPTIPTGIKAVQFGTWTETTTSNVGWQYIDVSYGKTYTNIPYVFIQTETLFTFENVHVQKRTKKGFKIAIYCDAAYTWSGVWMAVEPA